MRRRVARACFGAALAIAVTGVARQGHALCGTPDVIDTIPPDGAMGVPPNTPLSATYELGALHSGEPVLVTRNGGQARELAATYQSAVRTLVVSLPHDCDPNTEDCEAEPDFPGGQLRPDSSYVVSWPALAAVGEASEKGDGARIEFTTGNSPDTAAPTFAGLSAVRWDFEREFDSCSDTESERYLFDLRVPEPGYAGGLDLLRISVFQTRGPTLERDENQNQKPELVHSERYRGNAWLTIKRPIADGVGRVCFAAFFQAPSGRVSNGGNEEVCTTTSKPPFFEGCSVRGPTGDEGNTWHWWALSVMALSWLRARRHGRQDQRA